MNIFKNLGKSIGILHTGTESPITQSEAIITENKLPDSQDLKTILHGRALERKKRNELSLNNLYSKIAKSKLSNTVQHLDILGSGVKKGKSEKQIYDEKIENIYKTLCLQQSIFEREKAKMLEINRDNMKVLEDKEFTINEKQCKLEISQEEFLKKEDMFRQSKEILEKEEK